MSQVSHETLSEAKTLGQLLRQASHRLTWQRCLAGLLWGAAASLVLAIVAVLVYRLVSPTWALDPVLGWVLGVGPVVGVITALSRFRTKALTTALELERRVDLRERFSSLLALRGQSIHDEIKELLVRDGERHAQRVDVKRALPYERPLALLPALVAVVILVGTYAFFPEVDIFGAGEKRKREVAAKKREKERVSRIKKRQKQALKRIEERAKDARVPEKTRKLLRRMQERMERDGSLQQPMRRQALVGMQKMRQEIKERRNREEMQKLDRFLSQVRRSTPMETKQGQEVAKNIKQGNLDQAAKAFQKLSEKMQKAIKDGSLSPEDLGALQRDLDRLMKDMEMPGLSDELAKLMKNSGGIDPSQLAKFLDKTGADLSELARLMRERDLLDQALDEITFTQDELAAMPQDWSEG